MKGEDMNGLAVETLDVETRMPVLADRPEVRSARKVLVKIGTMALLGAGSTPDRGRIATLAATAAGFQQDDRRFALVTSGAVGAGRETFGVSDGRLGVCHHSACAAVGQTRLTSLFDRAFACHGLSCGQLLVSRNDMDAADRRNRLGAVLDEMGQNGVVPLLNENDAVTSGRGSLGLGDNDRLAADLAELMGADLLVLLTAVPGVFDKDPGRHADARLVAELDPRDDGARIHAGSGTGASRGGMKAKLGSALRAARNGCSVVIADGRKPGSLSRVLAGEAVGTWVPATPATSPTSAIAESSETEREI